MVLALPACGPVTAALSGESAVRQTLPTDGSELGTSESATTPEGDSLTVESAPTIADTTDPVNVEDVIPPAEQIPAEAMAVDGSMTVALPDDWRYAEEIETPYSVFAWTKVDATQNMSVAPLGPWVQIGNPENYLQSLIDAGNLGDATATYQGDATIDGYDGFWVAVEGPGYVANIYYINVDGGIKEITVNALHAQGLAEADGLVHTIDFL